MVEHATDNRKILVQLKVLRPIWKVRQIGMAPVLIFLKTHMPRTEEEKKKISMTMKNNPNAGGLRQGSGRGKKGWYKGFFCDSTYELAFIIYCLEHDIKVERCGLVYEYTYKGQVHKYHPDFILEDGSLVEIKGYMTDLVNVKLNSVTDRKITLMLEKDLTPMLEYAKSKYGDLRLLYEH